MKVILIKDVPKIGQKGDIKDLKEGYVRNMLLPRGLAKIATVGEVSALDNKKKAAEKASENLIEETATLFKEIQGKVVEISEKANGKGHLFAKVGEKEIISAIESQLGIKVLDRWVDLSNQIKSTGEYGIKFSFDKLKSEVILKVVAA